MSKPSMRWEVAVRKTVGEGPNPFDLDLAFRSNASRLVLFGPSGSGKSLTLKAMAGLLRPDAGRVCIDTRVLFDSASGIDLEPGRRGIGYVFQEYALFPHLTVRQNVGFGLLTGWRNPGRDAASERVDHWLATFGLGGCAGRYPDQLSGGQRQRTALARALVSQPRALLLDEPFAALDAPLRARLRDELGELLAQCGLPMLLITHDEVDVDAFADEVVEVEAGRTTARRSVDGRRADRARASRSAQPRGPRRGISRA